MSKRSVATLVVTVLILMMVFAACGPSQPASSPSGSPSASASASPSGGASPSASASTPPAEAEPVTINFWNGWTGPDGSLLQSLVENYNNVNKDGVTVAMDIITHAALREKLAASLLSGTNCELFLGSATGEYTVTGNVVAIDNIWDLANLHKEDYIEDMLDQVMYDGHLYGLPFQISSQYLFWNKDMFETAGLDPETPPKDWDELLEFSKVITDPSKNIFGGGLIIDGGGYMNYLSLAFGGSMFEGDSPENFTAILTDPKYKEGNLAALRLVKEYLDSGCMPLYTGAELDAMFMAQTLAMHINGAWINAGAQDAKLNYGISLLPEGPKGRFQHARPSSFLVMKGTEGRRLEGCAQFIAYWNNNIDNPYTDSTGKAPVWQWCNVLGYQPYLKSLAADKDLMSNPIVQSVSGFTDYFYECTPKAFYKDVGNLVFKPMIADLTVNGLSPEQSLENGQMLMEEVCADFKDD